MLSFLKKILGITNDNSKIAEAPKPENLSHNTQQPQKLAVEVPMGAMPPEYTEKDEDFMATHFEGMGNVWSAVLGNDKNGIAHCLQWIIKTGKIAKECGTLYGQDKTYLVLIKAPECSDIQASALLANSAFKKNTELWSAYPLFKGLPNNVVIKKVHAWSNNVEGVVAAYEPRSGAPISFFAPFFFHEFGKFTQGATMSISLGALALKIAKAEDMPFTISEGPYYEIRLKEFLQENPEKTKDDFQPIGFSYAGARILMPSTYACEWSFRCPVVAVEQSKLMDIHIVKITTDFVGLDDETIRGYLYASEHVLQGYMPEVGDDVEGLLWMTGYITPKDVIHKDT